MSDIMIVVAATEGGLLAVAHSAGLRLLPDTTFPFSGLETFSEPVLTSVGVIRTARSGFVAFAVDSSVAAVPART